MIGRHALYRAAALALSASAPGLIVLAALAAWGLLAPGPALIAGAATLIAAHFGIGPTIDAVLPGEPEHALAIKARGVKVGVAPFLRQGEELDCTGRGIDPGDRVLPTFGDPGGTVGRNDHAVGCRSRTQRDQIRFPGPGIEPAEFARGLRGEPDWPSGAGTGDFGANNIIREHMRALRQILEGSRYLIENYRGIGYELIVADTPGTLAQHLLSRTTCPAARCR